MMSTSERQLENLSSHHEQPPHPSQQRLPWVSLLALAMAAFITILTEALPAALLPQIAKSLHVSEALAGQTVSIYAVGSLLAAIPLTARTQGVRRRTLLLAALSGFVVANTVMTFSTSYTLTMAARFVAGMSAGLLWALLAGYAARMAPANQQGKAISIAMVGTPLALSLGVPLGAFLGTLLGWRVCFGIVSLLTLILMVWIRIQLPDFAGQAAGKQQSLRKVLTIQGVRPVLFLVLAFVLAHNILYTYIGPFLAKADMLAHMDTILLVFGIVSLVSILLTGALIERLLHALTLVSIMTFALATALLGIAGDTPTIVWLAVGLWGLSFGGAASLFQTTLAKRAKEAGDVAQSMLVTAWNLGIAGGGICGGVLLGLFGVGAFAPALIGLLAAAWVVSWWPGRAGVTSR